MQIGIDEKDNRVHISKAKSDEIYFCPLCKGELIQKHGTKRVAHFAHKGNAEHCDSWHYDMSEWHRDWQNEFPEDCQEIVLKKDGAFHRADVALNDKLIIEFQHSALTPKEFDERNQFYISLGYFVFWVFDTIEQWKSSAITKDLWGNTTWEDSFEALANYKDASGMVRIFLQKSPKKSSDVEIVEIKNVSSTAGVKVFDTGHTYSRKSFVEYANQFNFQESKFGDPVFTGLSTDNTHVLYNCPLHKNWNEQNTCPCSECEYFEGNDAEYNAAFVSICGYRWRMINPVIRTVSEITRENGCVSVKCIDVEGYEREIMLQDPEPAGKTLADLWDEVHPACMRCMNTKTGYFVHINNSPREQLAKYGQIIGYGINPKTYHHYSDFRKIAYASSPQWVLVWYE